MTESHCYNSVTVTLLLCYSVAVAVWLCHQGSCAVAVAVAAPEWEWLSVRTTRWRGEPEEVTRRDCTIPSTSSCTPVRQSRAHLKKVH